MPVEAIPFSAGPFRRPDTNPATVIAAMRDGSGVAISGKVFFLRLVKANAGGDFWSPEPFQSQLSDIFGVASVEAEMGAVYQASAEGCGKWSQEFTVSTNPTVIPETVG